MNKVKGELSKTHPPIAGYQVVKAPVDFLQFGDENVHATLTGLREEILREGKWSGVSWLKAPLWEWMNAGKREVQLP